MPTDQPITGEERRRSLCERLFSKWYRWSNRERLAKEKEEYERRLAENPRREAIVQWLRSKILDVALEETADTEAALEITEKFIDPLFVEIDRLRAELSKKQNEHN